MRGEDRDMVLGVGGRREGARWCRGSGGRGLGPPRAEALREELIGPAGGDSTAPLPWDPVRCWYLCPFRGTAALPAFLSTVAQQAVFHKLVAVVLSVRSWVTLESPLPLSVCTPAWPGVSSSLPPFSVLSHVLLYGVQ